MSRRGRGQMQRVPPPPNPGRNMLPMEITILLEQGDSADSMAQAAAAAAQAAAEAAAAEAAAAVAAAAAAAGGGAATDEVVKKEIGKGGPAPAWREQTLKRKRTFLEACESAPYYIRPLKGRQDIDRYSDRYKKIATISTVPWDKGWAADIVDFKRKGSQKPHRMNVDGSLDDLDLETEADGLESPTKKGNADGDESENEVEVVGPEPEEEEDNDDYGKSYFDPGDEDGDDDDDGDKDD